MSDTTTLQREVVNEPSTLKKYYNDQFFNDSDMN